MNMVKRILQALVALLVLMGVIVGGAWALVRFGRLDALLSLDWGQIWIVADDGSLVLGVITLIGWLAWTLATLSVVSELVAALSQQRWRLRLPGLGVFAPASAVLVTAIVGLIATQTVAPASAASASPAETPPAPDAPIAAPLRAPAQQDDQHAPVADGQLHIVQPGDDLWTLAEHYYADGSRWRQIAAANDTVLIEGTDLLQPGMALLIPELPAAITLDARAQTAIDTVVVQPGDTLSSIAEAHLGTADDWPQLAETNADLIDDPDAIDVGWTLQLPPAAQTEASQTNGPGAVDRVSEASPDRVGRPTNSQAPGDAAETQPEPAQQAKLAPGWVAQLPSAFGVVLTSALVGAFTLRRKQQQAGRPLGHRMPVLPAEADRLRAALADAHDTATLTIVEAPLGVSDDGPVNLDLGQGGVHWVIGEHGDDLALATAVGLAVACTENDSGTQVIAAGAPFSWLTTMDEAHLEVLGEVSAGVQRLRQLAAERSASLPPHTELTQLRAQTELAEAWRPILMLLAGEPGVELPAELGRLGITVLVCGADQTAPTGVAAIKITDGHARLEPGGLVFEPHLVSAPARRVLEDVFATANLTEYPTAPWWDHTPDAELPVLRVAAWPGSVEDRPVDSTIETAHPIVKLLGPVELAGARGEPPNRAIKQLQEYCAWLLEHPASSAARMAEALQVAEATRRSNMSRLRVWLGQDAAGELYLPDAYTGLIALHPAVTSDWEQLQLCVGGGVNRVSNAALIQALALVRGAPLADAAPGQWNWAEQLRADMTALIRDIGVVLGQRALELNDLELAGWAVEKAWLAAPDDELLVGIKLRLAHRSGDQAEVDRLVLAVTRRSRTLGVDLSDELVSVLQQVVEGRTRLRA